MIFREICLDIVFGCDGTFIVPRKSAIIEIPLFLNSLLIWIAKVGLSQIGVNLIKLLCSGASDCQNCYRPLITPFQKRLEVNSIVWSR